jgi:hypothetical protein
VNSEARLLINRDRLRLFGEVNRGIAFICECPDADCRRTIVLTPAEYELQRPDLLIHPSHGDLDD